MEAKSLPSRLPLFGQDPHKNPKDNNHINSILKFEGFPELSLEKDQMSILA